jgi:hypothetical protein
VIAEVLGWCGAGALLLAYGLLSARRLTVTGPGYQLLNVAGALGLALNGAVNGAWPSTALNLLWAAIGVAALLRRASRPAPEAHPSGTAPPRWSRPGPGSRSGPR